MRTFILSDTSTDFTTNNDLALLDPNKEYEAALVSLSTYNSIPNISENRNNKFVYSTDRGVSWREIALDTGAYELKGIKDQIKRSINENGDDEGAIEITENLSTLKSVVNIKNANYQVDFGVEHSLGPVLGFDKQVISYSYNTSPKKVDINDINSILVNIDIITGSYNQGRQFPTIHSFYPKVPSGYKIIEEPKPIYYPVTRHDLCRMRLWLTDQNGNSINLTGEKITVKIHVRETKHSVLNNIFNKSLLK
jgi:hypothetical protein